MIVFILLSLAAVMQQSFGNVDFNSESPRRKNKQKEIVDMHNSFRRSVRPTASNMLKMEWYSEAASNAERWAYRCILGHSSDSSRILGGIQCGENIYMSSIPLTWAKIIQSWYDEYKNFVYGVGANPPGSVIGHYTQIVWYKSHLIGCAAAYCPSSSYSYFYVCQYCPAYVSTMVSMFVTFMASLIRVILIALEKKTMSLNQIVIKCYLQSYTQTLYKAVNDKKNKINANVAIKYGYSLLDLLYVN